MSHKATIEFHREAPANWTADATDIGYVRAFNGVAEVTMPCSLAMLDDVTLEQYIKDRVLGFLDIATQEQEQVTNDE